MTFGSPPSRSMREASWTTDETFGLLRKLGVAYCSTVTNAQMHVKLLSTG